MLALKFLAVEQLAHQLARDFEPILFQVNGKLAEQGFMTYYYGDYNFNTDYRLEVKPRFIGTWRPPFVKLNQFYLTHMPTGQKIVLQF